MKHSSRYCRNPRKSRVQDRIGQALAEMVLVTPVLLLLVFGIIEFGLAFRTHQIVTNSAREGARVAVLPSTDGDNQVVEDVVRDRLDGAGLDPALAQISFTCNGGGADICDSSGDESGVEVRYPYRFLVLGPVVQAVAGGGCNGGQFGEVCLRTASIMRNE